MSMRRREELPELLCPAGDMESLYAAVEGGADAVYVGGVRFGARAFAKNFDIEALTLAVRYCHLHSVKLFVTVNTLLFDRELAEALEYCRRLYSIGVDAVICQDLGLIAAIRELLPELEIHASTQLSVNNSLGADIAYSLGCRRVVLARELSLRDIRSAVDNSRAEIEVFLHGALCVCHSGQCLFSSLVGGRSGNRGECAQPCRLPYKEGYQLSLRDLALAEHIPELIDSGVSSLKIEGRMKSPAYVFAVTKVYRRLLDEKRRASGKEMKLLAAVFSRGGFTDGYLTGRLAGMTGVRSDRDKEASREASAEYTPKMKRLSVRARAKIVSGEPSELTIFSPERSYTAYGAVPERALSSPLTRDSVTQRLAKTGATMLSLEPDGIELTLGEGLNLPPSAINALRREACLGFESSDRVAPKEVELPEIPPHGARKMRTALFLLPELIGHTDEAALARFDIIFVPLFSDLAKSGKYGVYIPPVIPDSGLSAVRDRLRQASSAGARHALVSNISHLTLAREAGLIPIGDFRLNITNRYAMRTLESLGVGEAILSAELTLPAVRDIGGGAVVYGRIPLMLTERCFMREGGCSGVCPENYALTDRRGAKFPIVREWEHRNLILNSAHTFMGDRVSELSSLGIEHFIFSTENGRAAQRVVEAYCEGKEYKPENIRRIGVKQ